MEYILIALLVLVLFKKHPFKIELNISVTHKHEESTAIPVEFTAEDTRREQEFLKESAGVISVLNDFLQKGGVMDE